MMLEPEAVIGAMNQMLGLPRSPQDFHRNSVKPRKRLEEADPGLGARERLLAMELDRCVDVFVLASLSSLGGSGFRAFRFQADFSSRSLATERGIRLDQMGEQGFEPT